ncbi:G-protein coupled peptide receptor [Aureococcus anophagefferens]|nr:G-protein coupled peptide receptor [Aureococcus anophagefferens]
MFFIGSSDGFINGAFPIIFAPTAVQEGAVFLVFLGDTNNTQAYALIGDYFATPPLNVDAYAAFQLLQAVGMAFGFGIPLVLTTERRLEYRTLPAERIECTVGSGACCSLGCPPAPMGHAASTYEKAQDGEPWDAKPVEFFGGDAGAHFAPVPPQFESVRRRYLAKRSENVLGTEALDEFGEHLLEEECLEIELKSAGTWTRCVVRDTSHCHSVAGGPDPTFMYDADHPGGYLLARTRSGLLAHDTPQHRVRGVEELAAHVAYVAAKSLLNGPEDTLSVITVESSKAHTKPNFKPKVMRDRYEADLTGFLPRSRWRFITIPKSKVADLSLRTLFCPTVVAKVAPRPRGRHFVMLVEPAERARAAEILGTLLRDDDALTFLHVLAHDALKNAPDALMRMLSKWKARANFEFVENVDGRAISILDALQNEPRPCFNDVDFVVVATRPKTEPGSVSDHLVRHYHRNIVIIKSVLDEPGRRSHGGPLGRSGAPRPPAAAGGDAGACAFVDAVDGVVSGGTVLIPGVGPVGAALRWTLTRFAEVERAAEPVDFCLSLLDRRQGLDATADLARGVAMETMSATRALNDASNALLRVASYGVKGDVASTRAEIAALRDELPSLRGYEPACGAYLAALELLALESEYSRSAVAEDGTFATFYLEGDAAEAATTQRLGQGRGLLGEAQAAALARAAGPAHLDTCEFELDANEARAFCGYVDRGQRIEARFSRRPIRVSGFAFEKMMTPRRFDADARPSGQFRMSSVTDGGGPGDA